MTAWATPAAVMAYVKAASRLPAGRGRVRTVNPAGPDRWAQGARCRALILLPAGRVTLGSALALSELPTQPRGADGTLLAGLS